MGSDILIKGMVCHRCIAVIKAGITALGYPPDQISLGKLSFNAALDSHALKQIEDFLAENGFSLISNRQVKIVTQVKDIIHDMYATHVKHDTKIRFSSLLSEKLHMNYDSISEIFTTTEGITLEKYVIGKRLEKVKELLVYNNMTLTEIAHVTGFSSLNHLSRQFKALTGLSASHFKSVKQSKQKVSGSVPEKKL